MEKALVLDDEDLVCEEGGEGLQLRDKKLPVFSVYAFGGHPWPLLRDFSPSVHVIRLLLDR
jgi:hypothetical protein